MQNHSPGKARFEMILTNFKQTFKRRLSDSAQL
jgi:hypothetical protein